MKWQLFLLSIAATLAVARPVAQNSDDDDEFVNDRANNGQTVSTNIALVEGPKFNQ